jgi:hypothetical protein
LHANMIRLRKRAGPTHDGTGALELPPRQRAELLRRGPR